MRAEDILARLLHGPGRSRRPGKSRTDEVHMKTSLVALLGLSVVGLALLVLRADAADQNAVPTTMRAAAIDQGGGPDVLSLHTLPVPALGANEVLIAVDTAGVASWDASIRQDPNVFGTHRHLPLVLGTDGAGLIAAVGSAVQGFKVGDKVYAYSFDNPKGGFYAEYVAVAAKHVGHVPEGLSLRDAGAIGTTALTAIQGIDDALHLKSGDTVIIHGAVGGVGTLAVQFAKLRGARVLATVSSEDGASLARSLGADAVVDGRQGRHRGRGQKPSHRTVSMRCWRSREAMRWSAVSMRFAPVVWSPIRAGSSRSRSLGSGLRILRYDAVRRAP